MYTSAECRAYAEEKLAQAARDDQHRNRLIVAAEAWLFLASKLRRVETSFATKKNYGVVDRAKRVKVGAMNRGRS
jgi:hypothetical protein